jgi:hypothetical protein
VLAGTGMWCMKALVRHAQGHEATGLHHTSPALPWWRTGFISCCGSHHLSSHACRYDAITVEDIYHAYSHLQLDDDHLFTCVGTSGAWAVGWMTSHCWAVAGATWLWQQVVCVVCDKCVFALSRRARWSISTSLLMGLCLQHLQPPIHPPTHPPIASFSDVHVPTTIPGPMLPLTPCRQGPP